jgi:hypothetical protein
MSSPAGSVPSSRERANWEPYAAKCGMSVEAFIRRCVEETIAAEDASTRVVAQRGNAIPHEPETFSPFRDIRGNPHAQPFGR